MANPEGVKAAVSKLENDLGVVLHSRWAEKQTENDKNSLVSFIKVTLCLSNILTAFRRIL